jgi:hypothetical protein
MLLRRELAGAFAAAIAAAAATARASVGPALSTPTPQRSFRMSNPNELVVNYLAAWNERDPARRYDIIARTWTDGGSYLDAHRGGEGHAALDAMIAWAQSQFPGYRLRLVSKIEAHNGRIRFSWAAGGAEDAPLFLAGTDFATVAPDGRLQSVTGFVDAAPAPAN